MEKHMCRRIVWMECAASPKQETWTLYTLVSDTVRDAFISKDIFY